MSRDILTMPVFVARGDWVTLTIEGRKFTIDDTAPRTIPAIGTTPVEAYIIGLMITHGAKEITNE